MRHNEVKEIMMFQLTVLYIYVFASFLFKDILTLFLNFITLKIFFKKLLAPLCVGVNSRGSVVKNIAYSM